MLRKTITALFFCLHVFSLEAISLDFTMLLRLPDVNKEIHYVFDDTNKWHGEYEDLVLSAKIVPEENNVVQVEMKIFGKNEQGILILLMEPVFKTHWEKTAVLGITDELPDGSFQGIKLYATPLK